MEEKKETFTYTYSAKEQEEIKAIRDKYVPQADGGTPMERLRRLDRSAARGATVVSLLVGIVSALLLGVGLCCTMLPGWESYFVLGIVVGVVGLVGAVATYPLYKRMVKRKRAELAPEVLRLSGELMK